MYRVMTRIETTKGCFEYDKPLLILLDEEANPGFVCYCSATGHGEGAYETLLKQSRPARKEEIENSIKFYGYDNIDELKIVKRKR